MIDVELVVIVDEIKMFSNDYIIGCLMFNKLKVLNVLDLEMVGIMFDVF